MWKDRKKQKSRKSLKKQTTNNNNNNNNKSKRMLQISAKKSIKRDTTVWGKWSTENCARN